MKTPRNFSTRIRNNAWIILIMFCAFGALECNAQPYVLHLANKTDCDYWIQVSICNNDENEIEVEDYSVILYAMSTISTPSTAPAKDVRVHILGNSNVELAVSFVLENDDLCYPSDYFDETGANPCGSGNHTFQSLNNGYLYSFGLY